MRYVFFNLICSDNIFRMHFSVTFSFRNFERILQHNKLARRGKKRTNKKSANSIQR